MQTLEFLLDTISHYARSDEGPPPGVPVHAGASFEKSLIDLCEAHGLAPLVMDSLVKLSLGPVLSELTVERLRAKANAVSDRNNYLLQQGERIGNIMADRSIDVRFAGSFALARAFYTARSTRRIDRIEMLVHEEDWIEIKDAMHGEGFREPDYIPALNVAEEILLYYQYFSPCFMHNSHNDTLRLSFRLFDYGPPEDTEECWEHALPPEEYGAGFKILRPEEQLIKTVTAWDIQGFSRMELLMDIGLILLKCRESLNWKYVDLRLKRAGLSKPFYDALGLAAGLLKLPVKAGLPLRSGAQARFFRALWCPFGGERLDKRTRSEFFKYYVSKNEKLSCKVRLFMKILSLPPGWISAFYGRPFTFWLKLKFIMLAMRSGLWSEAA